MSDFSEPMPSQGETTSQTDAGQPDQVGRQAGVLHTLGRLFLGGTLLAMDALTSWLQQSAQESIQAPPEPAPSESVLIPASEWETLPSESPADSVRYMLLGFVVVSQARLGRLGATLLRTERRAGGAMGRALKSLHTSPVLAPLRLRFDALVERGQAKVDHWRELGRAEEARSRALSQTALNQLVESSMNELREDSHIQVMIQEVIEAQGVSLLDEAIEEVRERTVTGDILLERTLRARLGRPPRESLPAPTFYVRGRQAKSEWLRTREPNLQGQYAGLASRLFAFVVDIVILVTALTVASWFVTTVNTLFGIRGFLSAILGPASFSQAEALLASLTAALFAMAYPVFFWVLTGQTPGKMLLGLRVVTTDGRRVSLGRAVRRLVGFILAALPLYLGFVWILVDDRRQGLHDKVGGTCVVYTWPARPDETFLK